MRLEALSRLNVSGEQLLRERALLRGQDPGQSIRHMQDALLDKRLAMVCLYDDLQAPCGIAGWRWQDDAQTYAQVLLMYLQPETPPTLGEALADYVFSELHRVRSLQVMEARVRDDSPGVWDAWTRHGAVFFERCRMVLSLGQLPVPLLPIPDAYRIVAWTDEHQPAAERLMTAAHADSVDAVAVPLPQGDGLAAALRRLRQGMHGGTDAWNGDASLVAVDRGSAVVGYVAVSSAGDHAKVADLAVDVRHRRRGLARLLLLRSIGVCGRQGCAIMSAAVTTRNPVRPLLVRVGFQAAECGKVAIWWRDGRHKKWRQ